MLPLGSAPAAPLVGLAGHRSAPGVPEGAVDLAAAPEGASAVAAEQAGEADMAPAVLAGPAAARPGACVAVPVAVVVHLSAGPDADVATSRSSSRPS